MKKLLVFALSLVVMVSCTPAGTINHYGTSVINNDSIEVSRYYFEKGESVMIAKLKNSNVITTSYVVGSDENKSYHNDITISPLGKNEIVYEDDSIIVIKKH